MSNYSIKQWIEKYDSGAFTGYHHQYQVDAGWYDWFCNENLLPKKTARYGKLIKKLSKSDKIDQNNLYVWFKNNCPIDGSLYDDIRFSDIKTGENKFVITPRCGHNSTPNGKKSTIWSIDTRDFLVQGTMKDVYKYFGV